MRDLGSSTIRIDMGLAGLEKDLKKVKQVIAAEFQDIQVEASKAATGASKVFGSFVNVAIKESFKFAGGVSGIADNIKKLGSVVEGEFKTGFNKGFASAASGVGTVLESVDSLGLSMSDLMSPLGIASVGFDVLRKVAVDNMDVIIDTVTDIINEFVDLYNESETFRGLIETIKGTFLILLDVVKLVGKSLFNTFSTIGKVIKSAFKGEFDSIGGIIEEGFKNAFDNVKEFAADAGKTIGASARRTLEGQLKNVDRSTVKGWADYLIGTVESTRAKLASVPLLPTLSSGGVTFDNSEFKGVMAQLKNDISTATNLGKAFGDSFDLNGEKTEAYEDAITSLIENGMSPLSPEITALRSAMEGLKQGAEVDIFSKLKKDLAEVSTLNQVFGDSFDLNAEKTALYEAAIKSLVNNGFGAMSPEILALQKAMEDLGDTTEGMVLDVSSELNKLAGDFFSMVGEAIAHGKTFGSILASGLGLVFGTLGDMMIRLGKVALQTAIGITAIRASFDTLNPVISAIAGAALVSFGSFIKAKVQDAGVPALAKGGLAFGETLAIVGDNPNASVDPEVIAPLSKLKSMLGGGIGGDVVLRSIIKGDDILLVGQRAASNQRRITGR